MKKLLHKKGWVADTNPAHVELPPIPLVNEKSTGKSYGDYVKLKLRRDPMSSTSELYEFMMSLFDHGDPDEILLFVQKFQMTLASTGTLETEVKVQHLRTLVCGEALRQFGLLYADAKNTETPLDVDYLLTCLAWYLPPVNSLSKQKRAMCRCMKNPRRLKVRRYSTRLIDLNQYLNPFQEKPLLIKWALLN